MTFLEAAQELLRQAGRPLSVKEMVDRSIKLSLLSHLGRAPEATMEARLTQELKKGERTLLYQVKDGVFGLRRYDKPAQAPVAAVSADEPAAAAPPPAPAASAANPPPAGDEPAEGGKRRRRRRGGRGRKKGRDGVTAAAPEEGTPEEAILAEKMAEEAENDPVGVEATTVAASLPAPMLDEAVVHHAPEPPPIDLDGFVTPAPRRFPREVQLDSEESLASEYADEIAAGGGVAPPVAGEVVDERTADEDRPMLAEIQGGRDRDRERHGRREKRDKRDKTGKPEKADRHEKRGREREAAPQRPEEPKKPEEPRRPVEEPPATANLAEVAVSLLRSLNDPRPVHVRQLTAMALKRKLATGDPEELWRAMKASLVAYSRARQAAGLRTPIRHQGSGLFVLVSARLEENLDAAEQALAARAQELQRATRDALLKRLRALPPASLEQVARIYLERAAFSNVSRLKRADETWYLAGTAQLGSLVARTMVAVRAGGGDLGRRSIGELRAGVLAKQLDRGLLLAPARLGAEAERELAAAGPPVAVFAGEALADELLRAGVGVHRGSLPLAYLDLDFFSDLNEQ